MLALPASDWSGGTDERATDDPLYTAGEFQFSPVFRGGPKSAEDGNGNGRAVKPLLSRSVAEMFNSPTLFFADVRKAPKMRAVH
eukprot:524413-Prorocentrum_minimum.AAC.1